MAVVSRRHGARPMIRLLRTTLIGGAVFLLPLVVVLVLLGRAIELAKLVLGPVLKLLGFDWSTFGVLATTSIAIVALIIVSLIAGLVAKTAIGRFTSRRLEEAVFGNMPQYRMAKSLIEGTADAPPGSEFTPVLVHMGAGWQLGYRLESLGTGWAAVFLPQAPTPMQGNITYVPEAELRPTSLTMLDATDIVRRLGMGSSEKLRGVDLDGVPGAR